MFYGQTFLPNLLHCFCYSKLTTIPTAHDGATQRQAGWTASIATELPLVLNGAATWVLAASY